MKYILIALVLIFSPVLLTHAQVSSSFGSEGLSIDLEPLYPEPFSDFTVSLNDYSVSNQVTEIKWKVDGKSITESNNQRILQLKSGDINKKTVIEAIVTYSGGMTQSIKKTVSPTYLDIIIEPQTRTPSFYLGRSLPSIGSKINLTTILNGDVVGSSNYIYTWRINNVVIEGGSQRGKNKISTTFPFGTDLLVSLDVNNLNGETITRRTVQINNVSPSVLFYEVNPLYGQLTKPTSNLNLIGDSATIKAEPYNLDIQTYNSPDILEWKINGFVSNPATGNPYEVTLAREEGQAFGGSSAVDFHVRSLKELLQGVQGSFKVNF